MTPKNSSSSSSQWILFTFFTLIYFSYPDTFHQYSSLVLPPPTQTLHLPFPMSLSPCFALSPSYLTTRTCFNFFYHLDPPLPPSFLLFFQSQPFSPPSLSSLALQTYPINTGAMKNINKAFNPHCEMGGARKCNNNRKK